MSKDAAIAIARPVSTPANSVPKHAVSDTHYEIKTIVWSCRGARLRDNPPSHTKTPEMTMAASANRGRCANTGVKQVKVSPTSAAATRPAVRDLAPLSLLTADRETDPATGKAEKAPPITLAMPMPSFFAFPPLECSVCHISLSIALMILGVFITIVRTT